MDQIRFYPVRDLPELNKSTDIMAGVNGSFKIPDTDQMNPIVEIFFEIIKENFTKQIMCDNPARILGL